MFIPLGDDNSRRSTRPFVVYFLIAANAFVWYLQLNLGERFTMGYSVVPYEIMHRMDIVGTKSIFAGEEIIRIPFGPGPSPIYLTLLSAMFMHGSWMHIIGNMVYLWIFGDQIEDELGHWKFLFFYLVCGILGSLAHIYPEPNSLIPSLGASGAIAGVLGAYLLLHPRNRVRVLIIRMVTDVPAVFVLGFWFVLQVMGQFGPRGAGGGVAYLAHIGGFVAGIVLVWLLRPLPENRRQKATYFRSL